MAERWGKWAAILIVAIGGLYVAVGLLWLLSPDSASRPFSPGEPYLSLLELLILASAPVLVVLAAAIHARAPPSRKPMGAIALAFMTAFAALTGSVHFVRLTAHRQIDPGATGGPAPDMLDPGRWPSAAAAVDFLAWDLFFGLALLFAAATFAGGGLAKTVRIGLAASGLLCVAGTLGPATGNMDLQLIATAGYAFLMPLTCIPLAMLMGREAGSFMKSAPVRSPQIGDM